MTNLHRTLPTFAILCAAAALANAAGQAQPMPRAVAVSNFEAANPNSPIALRTNGTISRVYGKAFSQGATSQESAQRFVDQNANMWGVAVDELIAKGPFQDGRHTQPIGYLPETDSYKFTGHYYTQTKADIPVFRSKLVLLVRNEANNPLVLASSLLFDLSAYQPDNQVAEMPVNEDRIIASANKEFASNITIDSTERMIYAGTDSNPAEPVIADVSHITFDGFEKFIVITDALSGEILYKESLIHRVDLFGNASAMASEGPGSDNCEPEVVRPLPYLSVDIAGGNSAFTDVNGDFVIPNGGTADVTVSATLTGEWFEVSDFVGSVASESVLATPPGPADLLFNAPNTDPSIRAQVNAYIEANRVRDFVVAANPAYPQVMQNQFPIIVNRNDGFCPGNAWYDGSSINFCSTGSGFPNTAWSSVVHHEYGHHLVAVGGSGQGQYGEGMGDVMSTIILDDPRLGLGFFGSCSGSLRNADNNIQYPCGDAIHTCGQLISGCVWDTRNELIVTEPASYIDILNFLAVNSILVHTGDLITPQITIDWLTLDDDDADIGNGTPHYAEIAAGFGAHNMDAPALNLIDISYPAGHPEMINPNGGTTMAVDFAPLSGTVDPSTPTLMVDSGSGFVAYPMTQDSGTLFEATFPAIDCGSSLTYYITSQTTNGAEQTSPAGAPTDGTFSTLSAFGAPTAIFEDNFQTDTGWIVSGNVLGRTTGKWERGIPAGDGSRGDAPSDYDGSGMCYLTGNGGAGSNTDVDGGSTILSSPVLNATGMTAISYARWYDNSVGASPFADTFRIEISDDAGFTWNTLEVVGPAGPEVVGGWFTKQFSLTNIPGFTPNNMFVIRFTASDLGDGSVIEAAVDAIELLEFACQDTSCPADMTGDGILNFFDVSAFLSAFGEGDLAADFTNDGILNFFDVSEFLGAFAEGCP